MRVAIIADTFPPLRTSGAIQLRDLSVEFARQGHETTLLVADPTIATRFAIGDFHGVTVARLKTPQSKDVNYLRRALAEFVMPFSMIRSFKASPLKNRQFDAIVWYSPTIFLGPIVRWLKKHGTSKSYLILRDIFPQWAADMGVISHGPIFRVLDWIANYQYRSADIIGVQTQGNLGFLATGQISGLNAKLEVLHNWLADEPNRGCSIDISKTSLSGRCIFVYAGNMGAAQDMDKLVRLAKVLIDRRDIGFLFVGRGSEVERLRAMAHDAGLTNIVFEDEIDPADIPGLYAQCHVGMICLDGRHKTHNIPGKFLSYIRSGLPVLASVNPGNDLVGLIAEHDLGRVSVDQSGADLRDEALALLGSMEVGRMNGVRFRMLADNMFSAASAVRQITTALGCSHK